MRILSVILLIVSFNLQAETDDFRMRESWVKTLKELLADIESKDKNKIVETERRFIELIESAWADSRYDCFYGGWPSVKSGKYCQSPARTNSSYDQTACKENELQCQPLLFGKGLCVSSKTQSDRNKTFANCESRFKSEKGGNYDFLESPTRKESEDLQELSRLARDICEGQKSGICKKVLDKFPSGMKAIDQGFNRSVASVNKVPVASASPMPNRASHDLECQDPDHEHEKLADTVSRVVERTGDSLYDKIKTEFLSSPFCDPAKILNNPSERPNAIVMANLVSDLKNIDPVGKKESREDFMKRMAAKYKLSESVVSDVMPILNAMRPTADAYEERRTLIAKARMMIMQDFIKNDKNDGSFNDMIKDDLVRNHIFSENEEGEPVCPFVTKDAFDKAMAGREKVLKTQGSSLNNKNLLTIVDYTRPSNERRMFVIDISTGKVLHNTWVAHGGGNGNADGVDGFGSSPEMSNKSGSNLSSDGFIIATAKASGASFGNNVLLRGIDTNNSNLAARSVVMHGWGSPYYAYSTGVEEYNSDTEKYDPPYDVIERVKKVNVSESPRTEMEKAFSAVSGSAATSPYMNPTEGCLGVPMVNVKQLDRKGRDKTQLELLRDDLPGSLIFNYSGPNMKSKYF